MRTPSRCQVMRFGGGAWCCRTGLNCRPLHYQWSALPLSYGSMPRIRESARRAPTRRPILATRTPFAQAREGPERRQKQSRHSMIRKSRLPRPAAAAFSRTAAGRSGSRSPRRAPGAPWPGGSRPRIRSFHRPGEPPASFAVKRSGRLVRQDLAHRAGVAQGI